MKMKLTHVKAPVTDLERSLKWYTEVLGFEVASKFPKDKPVYYHFKNNGGAIFAIGVAEKVIPYERYNFMPEDVDKLWEKLKDKVTVIEPLFDTPWGTRKFTIADTDGNEIGFYRD